MTTTSVADVIKCGGRVTLEQVLIFVDAPLVVLFVLAVIFTALTSMTPEGYFPISRCSYNCHSVAILAPWKNDLTPTLTPIPTQTLTLYRQRVRRVIVA